MTCDEWIVKVGGYPVLQDCWDAAQQEMQSKGWRQCAVCIPITPVSFHAVAYYVRAGFHSCLNFAMVSSKQSIRVCVDSATRIPFARA